MKNKRDRCKLLEKQRDEEKSSSEEDGKFFEKRLVEDSALRLLHSQNF